MRQDERTTRKAVNAHDVLDLMPSDTPAYMAEVWLSCLSWALGSAETVAAFRADTGMRWQPGATGLEQRIDVATGMHWVFLRAFTLWMNVKVWGPMDGPAPDDAVDPV